MTGFSLEVDDGPQETFVSYLRHSREACPSESRERESRTPWEDRIPAGVYLAQAGAGMTF
jgi:hypothetical protein